MARRFASRTYFVRLRNVSKEPDGSFQEADHLGGDVDMVAVMSVLLHEQARRHEAGDARCRLPFRPIMHHRTVRIVALRVTENGCWRASAGNSASRSPARWSMAPEIRSVLDLGTIGEMLNLMSQLAEEGMTMLGVPHEMNCARRVANHVFLLERGAIIEQGPPSQIFDAPLVARTRDCLSHLGWEG